MAEQLPRGLLADPAVQRAMLLPVARRTYTDPGDDITEELSGLEFAAPGLLYDPIMGMAQTGAMLMGDMPVNPDVVTQTMLDAPLVSGLLSAATGAAPRGAVLGANVLPSRLPEHLVPLTDDKLEFALPSTKYLVKKIREKAPDAELGLSLSENQVGKSNYLTLTHPNKRNIEIRLSDHATGPNRAFESAAQFSDYVPEGGKPKFGQISRESFDKRIDEVLSYYDDGIELGANKAPTAALPGLLDDVGINTTQRGNVLEITKIETPDNLRGRGLADQRLEQLIQQADADGTTLALTPSNAFGANKSRLTKWYKRHGFVPNKGRNKDFATRESMVRPPRNIELGANPATAALPSLLQDRSGNIDQRGVMSRTPRKRDEFPIFGLLGQRRYTATAPDGSI